MDKVDIDKDGRIYNIHNDLVPDTIIERSKKKEERTKQIAAAAAKELSSDEAKGKAIEASGAASDSTNEVLDNELVYYPHNGVPTLAWKVIVKTSKPLAEWRIYLDAVNGSVLDKINQLKYKEGKGKIFDPNPVVSLNNTRLEDDSQIPAAAYSDVVLRDLQDTGAIDGPFVSTRATSNRSRI
jgi:Zn-dependent metalloprotease